MFTITEHHIKEAAEAAIHCNIKPLLALDSTEAREAVLHIIDVERCRERIKSYEYVLENLRVDELKGCIEWEKTRLAELIQ